MSVEAGGHQSGANAHGASLLIWFLTFVIIVGTIIGGIALIYWNWPMFWTGVGLFLAGCAGGYFAKIMDAVSEYGPASEPDSAR